MDDKLRIEANGRIGHGRVISKMEKRVEVSHGAH